MSEEMAIGDNASSEEAKLNGDEASAASATDAAAAAPEPQAEPEAPPADDAPVLSVEVQVEKEEKTEDMDVQEPEVQPTEQPSDMLDAGDGLDEEEKRGIKRRASAAFSDAGKEDFKGFETVDKNEFEASYSEVYSRIVDRLEAEVSAAVKDLTPLRTVMATPPAPPRASKRPRQDTGEKLGLDELDRELSAAVKELSPENEAMPAPLSRKRPSRALDTDGSRPSSALSSRSDGDGVISTDATSAASSPAQRGRRATTEMSSPLLRIPLERGWKRELVYRAALDAHSRRNADIYYYTPQGKKLRSTREVAEHLSGTGLTLENFSFFKEPLGMDDPEKEIIRDAKMIRRVESPVAAPPPAEGKRTPKPKPPKGASPEHVVANVKSPPAKIKVKSVGSRLSTSSASPAPAPATPKQQKKPAAAATDNNNSAAWKKPRPPAQAASVSPAPSPPPAAPHVPPPHVPPPHVPPPHASLPQVPLPPPRAVTPPQPPPPLQSRPPPSSPDVQSPRQLVQPCSMTCGRGLPTLACAACLCLYHPACIGYNNVPSGRILCKNCRSSPPPLEPPPLTHKSGVSVASLPAPVPRRLPGPLPVPVPVPVPKGTRPPDKRVTLRMKVAGGGPDGERVWAVAKPPPQAAAPPRPAPPLPPAPPLSLSVRASLPQSVAVLNGRRFIVVPRSLVAHNEDKKRGGRVANGAASPPAVLMSPRRRGRGKADDTDHFTAFYNTAQDRNYNVVVQIFQYLGMRDLAHSARVCKLWRQLAATPALWRHVRMKNSHVSDWGGLCAALKRHGTKRLDLRKMLLPQNDATFWDQFAQHIGEVDSLERIEMCRCPARAVESVCASLPSLRALSALAIRDARLDPEPLSRLTLLHELRLKSMAGLTLTRDLRPLAQLNALQHLSLTSIKDLGWCLTDVVGQLPQLETLELGECTFRAEFAHALRGLTKLRRLRLERGTAHCAAPAILRSLAGLPLLTRLELVNIDVKVGFDDALAECKNIQRLLIIPTYVSQSATTNKQVLSGVLRLKETLTHLMWGVTIELLRVTELFIDQCEQGVDKRRDVGECIPVLKPVPGCRLPDEHHHVAGPPQVEILPLPTLQRLLSAQLPNTKLKLLRIPFHATWRQSLADFQ